MRDPDEIQRSGRSPPCSAAERGLGMGDRDRGRDEKPRGDRDRHREREPPPKHPLVRMAEKVTGLMERDERIGFPRYRPHVDKPETFGWLFAAQKILLHHIMREDTRVVVQIGAYLGKTTLFIQERSPNAVIFVLDEWDNKKLQEEEAFNKNYENIVLFEEVPFYEMFLYNLWEHKAKVGADGRMTGVVPMRMGWREGFKLLVSLGVRPDALYWEGFPLTQKEVEDLLEACVKTFPGVSILGDGFQVKEVREGVLSKKHSLFHGHRPYVELGKCWTYARIREHQLGEARELYYLNAENKAAQSVLAVEGVVEEEKEGTTVKKKVALGNLGFADLLSSFKTTSKAKKEEEAAERARIRKREEEEAERERRKREEEEERIAQEEEDRRRRERSRSQEKGNGNGGRKREREGGAGGKKGKKAREEEEEEVQEEPVVPQPVVPSVGLLPIPSRQEVEAALARKRQVDEALRRDRKLQEEEGRGWGT